MKNSPSVFHASPVPAAPMAQPERTGVAVGCAALAFLVGLPLIVFVAVVVVGAWR